MSFLTLVRYRPMEYDSEDGPWDPISGGASALLGTIGSFAMGFADFPVEILKALIIKPEEPKPGAASEPISRSTTLEAQAKPMNTASSGSSGDAAKLNPPFKEKHSSANGAVTENIIATVSTSEPHANNRSNTCLPGILHHKTTPHAEEPSIHRSGSAASGGPEPSSSHHPHRPFAGNQGRQIPLEAALGAGKGIGRIVGAGLKSPMDFTLGLARGFHNAPKLYGDESVRQADKVTGFQSGLKAAGKVRSLGEVLMYMLTGVGIWPWFLRRHIRFSYSAF